MTGFKIQGWVEAEAETHQKMVVVMGFTTLYPSYAPHRYISQLSNFQQILTVSGFTQGIAAFH